MTVSVKLTTTQTSMWVMWLTVIAGPMQRWIVLVVKSINVAFSLPSLTHADISKIFFATKPASYYNYLISQLFTRSSATTEKQRVSCPHGGGRPSSPHPFRPLWLQLGLCVMRMVEFESHNVRTSSVPSVKRTLRWIGHSRSSVLVPAGIQNGLLS